MSAYTYNSAALYSISITGRTICPQQEKISIFCTLPDTLLKLILPKTPSFLFVSIWFYQKTRKLLEWAVFLFLPNFFLTVRDKGVGNTRITIRWGVKKAADLLSVSL